METLTADLLEHLPEVTVPKKKKKKNKKKKKQSATVAPEAPAHAEEEEEEEQPNGANIIKIQGTSTYLDLESNLLKGEWNSIYRSWYNQTHKYKDLRLKVTYGSLGFGLPHEKPIHYEHGQIDATLATFIDSAETYTDIGDDGKETVLMDIHSWLEDSEGNIFDVFEGRWKDVCVYRDKTIKGKSFSEIYKMSPKHLAEKQGLCYLKASPEFADDLEAFVEKHYRSSYLQFLVDNPLLA